MFTVARSRTKTPKGKAQPPKAPKSKRGKKPSAEESKRPAPPPSPRQRQFDETRDPNADEALDELVRETYDVTADWLKVGATMRAKRSELADKMRSKGLDIYSTHDGYQVKRATLKEKLTIKRTDDVREVDIGGEEE